MGEFAIKKKKTQKHENVKRKKKEGEAKFLGLFVKFLYNFS